MVPARLSQYVQLHSRRLQGRALQTAPSRSLQQRDDDREYGNYRVVSIEVFERERCYLDEFAISVPLCRLKHVVSLAHCCLAVNQAACTRPPG